MDYFIYGAQKNAFFAEPIEMWQISILYSEATWPAQARSVETTISMLRPWVTRQEKKMMELFIVPVSFL